MQIDRKFFLIKFFCSIVIAFPAAQPCCAGTAEVTAVHTLGSGRRRYRELHNLVSDHVIISAENWGYNVTLHCQAGPVHSSSLETFFLLVSVPTPVSPPHPRCRGWHQGHQGLVLAPDRWPSLRCPVVLMCPGVHTRAGNDTSVPQSVFTIMEKAPTWDGRATIRHYANHSIVS